MWERVRKRATEEAVVEADFFGSLTAKLLFLGMDYQRVDICSGLALMPVALEAASVQKWDIK